MKTTTLCFALLFFIFSNPAFTTVPDSVLISHTYSEGGYEESPYHLNARNETHFDSLERTSFDIVQYWNGQEFTNGYKHIYDYDSMGRNYETVMQTQNVSTWINSTRTYTYYNTFQNIDSVVKYNWANGAWEVVSGEYYTYDLNQHLVFTDKGNYRVYYYPDSASHDTLEIDNQFISNVWRNTYMYQHTYDSLGRKASTVYSSYYLSDSTWHKNDSTTYVYYPDDSLFMAYDYDWYNSMYILQNVDSIVYSNDTMYTYHADDFDSAGIAIFEYRDVLFLASTQYFWYETEYESWDGVQWSLGEYRNYGSYDSTTHIAHSYSNSSGSWSSTDFYFDNDGHLINNVSNGYIHAGDHDVHSDTYYYYYLTNGDPGLCPGGSDSLWIDTGMTSYLWNTGDTTFYKIVSAEGIYFCNIVNQYGHPFQSEPHYQYTSLNPTAPREPDSSITACGRDHFSLSAPDLPIYSYQWLRNDTVIPGANSFELEFWYTSYTPPITGNYTLVVSNACGSDTSTTTHITFHNPNVNINPDAGYVYLCPGDTIVLIADTGFADYLWNTGDVSSSVISTPGHVNYHLTVHDAYGCPDYEEVNVQEVLSPNYLPLTIQQQDSMLVASLPSYLPYYQWFLNGVAIPGAIYHEYEFVQSGFYKYQFTASGCTYESVEQYFEFFSIELYQNPLNKCLNVPVYLSNYYQLLGGIAPFHYQWNPATNLSNDTIASPICTSNSNITYILTVTDSLGNIAVDTLPLNVNQPLTLDISAVYPGICPNYYGGTNKDTLYCNTNIDGYYNWYRNGISFESGTNDTSAITTLGGQIWLHVSNGCLNRSDTINIATIPNPPIPVFSLTSIPADWCIIDSIGLVAEVPNPELYQFNWNIDGPYNLLDDTIYIPDAGVVFVRISDSLGCTTQASFNASQFIPDTIIAVDLIPDGLVTACLGDTIELVSTYYSNYNYEWHNYDNDLLSTTSTCDVIYSGQYFVTVDNGFGCHGTDSVYLSFNQDPESVQVTYDGYYLTATSSQYTNNWQWYLNDTLIAGATDPIYHPVLPGNYEAVAITGLCGTGVDSFLVTCAVGILATDISCNQVCDGSASLNITGGGLYSIIWSTGDTAQTIQNLCPGIYWVQVTDSSACFSSDTIVLTEPTLLTATTSATMNTCYQFCDGTATAIASGGTQPYSYLWSNGETSASVDSLCAGIFIVNILDVNGCPAIDSIDVTEPLEFVSSVVADTLACYQSCDGTALVNATGGTLPYTYNWSNGETSSSIDSLCAGAYTVNVLDANGCVSVDSINLTAPPQLIAPSVPKMISCYQLCDGMISVNALGGTPPYSWLWSTTDTTSSIDSLCPGNYWWIITDANGCITSGIIGITEPAELIITGTVTDASCAVCADGSVAINFTGGTQPYSILWSTGDTTTSLTGILPGDYSVCITDSAGCELCDTFTVGMMVNVDFEKFGSMIQVFPNPVNQTLTVTWKSDQQIEKVNLLLRNEIGEIVYSTVTSMSQVLIDVSALTGGIYLLEFRMEDPEMLMKKKVVVMH